ncbi:hypothetical protein Adt_14550 [Abeliophyllum distichum]|uniref:Uncharacterized protein n=1 Tax=Abeliophyllum distichum TaxID=126358 RepID=A0ABD1U0K0_9LAMI
MAQTPSQWAWRPTRSKYNYQDTLVNAVNPRMSYITRDSNQYPRKRSTLSPAKYCRYHHVHDHDNNECLDVNVEMDNLIVERYQLVEVRQPSQEAHRSYVP